MKNMIFWILASAFILLQGFVANAGAATHPLPMTLDFTMMEALVLANYYKDPGKTAVVINEEEGCTYVVLSHPKFSQSDGKLMFESGIKISVGKELFGNCVSPAYWEGYLTLIQKPVLNPDKWSISFKIVDTRLMSVKRKPVKVAGMVWKVIKEDVTSYLSGIKINLSLPIQNLENTLLPLFTKLEADQALRLVQSLRPGTISVLPDALRLESTIEIQDEWLVAPSEGMETALTGPEMDAFLSAWETWDTFLIDIMLSLSDQTLRDEERQQLLDTVLDIRFAFIEELGRPVMRKDFVRRQFTEAWGSIQSIFRHHLPDKKDGSLLSSLSFFAASDALASLDALGPALGIEITNAGFNRLARMLIAEGAPAPLPAGKQNSRLRQLLGLPMWTEQTIASGYGTAGAKTEAFFRALLSLALPIGTVHASQENPSPITPEEMSQWVYDRSKIDSYAGKMREFLSPIAQSTLQKSVLPEQYHAMFQRLVLATAWQESCFRQFIRQKEGDIKYLTSYNGSSVGLMQINERVWKGIYDIDSLRWAIEYNARAGCEILDVYFNRYALRYMKKMTPPPDLTEEQLSSAIYAIYNGGPKEFHKFLSRFAGNTLYESDTLFKEKYDWTNQEDWGKLSECLN